MGSNLEVGDSLQGFLVRGHRQGLYFWEEVRALAIAHVVPSARMTPHLTSPPAVPATHWALTPSPAPF